MQNDLVMLFVLALVLALVNASVFVYYPISITLGTQKPPVVFRPGSNADVRDLWGTSVTISLGNTNTSSDITIHPTYQRNYYKDILRINNTDPNNAYYIAIRVKDAFTDTLIVYAYLHIYDLSGNLIATIDLKQTATSSWLLINPLQEWRCDLEIAIADQGTPTTAPALSDTLAQLDLVISTQNVEAPPTPSG